MANPTHSKSIDKVRLPLPEIIDPPKRRCVTIEVPDDRMHFAAFWGHFFGMTRWYTWKLDSEHKGKALAAVYQTVYDDARERFVKGEDSCVGCAHVNQPFSPDLLPGETKTFRVTVEAGEFQLLPILLKANQSMSIIEAVGQWRDSTYHPTMPCPSNWETPEGFVIDAGGALPADTFPTDIMPAEPHMRLLFRVNACGVLSYHVFDFPSTFTVPPSVPPEGVFVEFLGNCPIDAQNEIAPGFLGYGMLCVTVTVSDPTLCPQVFLDFTTPPNGQYTLFSGSIQPTSPIGEGPAVRAADVSPTVSEVGLNIFVDDCTIRDFAFTFDVLNSQVGSSFGYQWQAFDALDISIASGLGGIPYTDSMVGSQTVDFGDVPGVSRVRLVFSFDSSIQFDPDLEVWIDNVFIN